MKVVEVAQYTGVMISLVMENVERALVMTDIHPLKFWKR